MAAQTCSKCGRTYDYGGECLYCWGLEAGTAVNAGREPRKPNTSTSNSGCAVVGVLVLSGLIPLLLLLDSIFA
ncbi:hypothetical protein [Actinoalloteichus spitiensis]|uniref:hypothetical protein n=1 Tax=Actinoalloteichus spitiensis TaxID=252394 RepID=UPI0003057E58|nr:hypothetical protein [Actinoalloteichus spitiensis]